MAPTSPIPRFQYAPVPAPAVHAHLAAFERSSNGSSSIWISRPLPNSQPFRARVLNTQHSANQEHELQRCSGHRLRSRLVV